MAPTILEIVGFKEEAAGMKGQSFVAWLRGKSRKDLDILVESFYPRKNFGWSELVGLVSKRWRPAPITSGLWTSSRKAGI